MSRPRRTSSITYSEMELYRIIRDYGEDRFAKNIAKHIVQARQKKEIETTGELTEIIRASIPAKVRATGGHPAKRTFQAIRIELNRELDVLEDSIDTMIERLAPGGRLSIITFHSLEDRIVKNRFRTNENPCICPPDFPVCVCGRKSRGRVITRKPILPTDQEMEENPRSKSAKLRVFEKIINKSITAPQNRDRFRCGGDKREKKRKSREGTLCLSEGDNMYRPPRMWTVIPCEKFREPWR